MNKSSKFKIVILAVLIVLVLGFMYLRNQETIPFAGSADLSWNANTESDLAGYKIYYGTNPRTGDCPKGGYENFLDVKKKTSYRLEKLEIGKTYYFSVTSYNSAGKESCFSEEMKKTIAKPKFEWIRQFFRKK